MKKYISFFVISLLVGVSAYFFQNQGLLDGILGGESVQTYVLQDSRDGNSRPDYRFLKNHVEETKEDVKDSIKVPEIIENPTKHRCSVVMQRLDEGGKIQKFDVAYMMYCYESYPELFVNFFEDL